MGERCQTNRLLPLLCAVRILAMRLKRIHARERREERCAWRCPLGTANNDDVLCDGVAVTTTVYSY